MNKIICIIVAIVFGFSIITLFGYLAYENGNTAVMMFSLPDGTSVPQNQICYLGTSYPSGGGGGNNDCIILSGGSNERTFDLPNNGKQHVILYPNYYFEENYSEAFGVHYPVKMENDSRPGG